MESQNERTSKRLKRWMKWDSDCVCVYLGLDLLLLYRAAAVVLLSSVSICAISFQTMPNMSLGKEKSVMTTTIGNVCALFTRMMEKKCIWTTAVTQWMWCIKYMHNWEVEIRCHSRCHSPNIHTYLAVHVCNQSKMDRWKENCAPYINTHTRYTCSVLTST